MQLSGSCYCGAVTFTLEAYAAVPYMRCYCSICRKTAGTGGYAINLGARAETLEVSGEDAITVFHANIDGQRSPAERRFCSHCGTALWLWDPRWPEQIHPMAGAIDTPLPIPPEWHHILLQSKPDWVPIDKHSGDTRFNLYPDSSLEAWHRARNLFS